jgi:hypothetical protein
VSAPEVVPPRRRPGRGRRRFFWLAVLVATAAVVAGAVVAGTGYAATGGPDGAVRSYFSALAAGDAPRALAWGPAPAGSTGLLTSTVLRAQLALAPIEDVRVTSVDRAGRRATVHVGYTLGFDWGDRAVTASVPVREQGGDWRLVAAAVPVTLTLPAAHRATLLGGPVPTGAVALFPGAVPVRFDSAYLELTPASSGITFGAAEVTTLQVEVTTAGVDAMRSAVTDALTHCLAVHVTGTCPLPDDRYVPGSFSGSLRPGTSGALQVDVESDADGVLQASGTMLATVSYRRLDFTNRAVAGHGAVGFSVQARAYAVAPLHVAWSSS